MDASVWREFVVSKKAFVRGGFYLPEAKSDVAWIDQDSLYVGTDFGPGSLTDSGYPREIRFWRWGQPIENSRKAFAVNAQDVSESTWVAENETGEKFHFQGRNEAFYRTEWNWLMNPVVFAAGEAPQATAVEFSDRCEWGRGVS